VRGHNDASFQPDTVVLIFDVDRVTKFSLASFFTSSLPVLALALSDTDSPAIFDLRTTEHSVHTPSFVCNMNASSGSAPNLPLLGKTALVTGSARGIGAGIAWKLVCDGANVGAITDPDSFTW
jgi:hypothetical protein